MSPKEASDKLNHYVDIHGSWIRTLTPEQARGMAITRREDFEFMDRPVELLNMLCEAIHLDAVANCLEVLA